MRRLSRVVAQAHDPEAPAQIEDAGLAGGEVGLVARRDHQMTAAQPG